MERYVACTSYVVRKFSICKDFSERQGMDTWRGMVHALCCKEIFHLYGFSRETGDGYVERYVTLLHALCCKEIFHL